MIEHDLDEVKVILALGIILGMSLALHMASSRCLAL